MRNARQEATEGAENAGVVENDWVREDALPPALGTSQLQALRTATTGDCKMDDCRFKVNQGESREKTPRTSNAPCAPELGRDSAPCRSRPVQPSEDVPPATARAGRSAMSLPQ